MNKPLWSVAVVLLALLLGGCAGPAAHRSYPPAPVAATPGERVSALEQQHQAWRGTPYRIGGTSRAGIDCSAFVQTTYATLFDYPLPRTTADQQQLGQTVTLATLAPGDLLFFRTSEKVRHVAIYLDRGRFLHASTSRGVMLSRLDNPYWRRHFREARRVLP